MENCRVSNYVHKVENQPSLSTLNNKYVYFKQNFVHNVQQPVVSSKVLVNPHFNKKVFVNPNYQPNNVTTHLPGRIHINPNISTINLTRNNSISKIHINPKILRNVPNPTDKTMTLETNLNQQYVVKQPLTYSSKTKLIRTPLKEQKVQELKKRTSIYSKFKIVKSPLLNKSCEVGSKNKLLFNTRYRLKRTSTNKLVKSPNATKAITRFKLDNRRKCVLKSLIKPTKFVFVNRFISISDIAKKVPLRTNKSVNLVNISGIIYKNSPNRLQKTSMTTKKEKRRNSLIGHNRTLTKSKYKIIRLPHLKSPATYKKKIEKDTSRYLIKKQKISREKLKKCNIPCPHYRKFGKCKGKDLGKCPRKHDPDQIALCTKFLQGACIDSKCLLSHNVSAEKMPTCKFYLEGSCSKDNCPYLHVRISPKADICKNFVEGYCKKAFECDKRHQFLCPDFEKKGTCLKPRCPYPHGRMVRKYSDFNKHKFAKKSSNNNKDKTTLKRDSNLKVNDIIQEKIEPEEVNNVVRYYNDNKVEKQNSVETKSSDDADSDNRQNKFRLRPKLGTLPSYISLEDT